MSNNFLNNFGKAQIAWMYACSKCGECVDECPVYQQTADNYTAPGFKIKKMRPIITKQLFSFLSNPSSGDIKNLTRGLYECTLCGRCASVCPYTYDLVDLWERARESAVDNGLEPAPIREMIANTVADKNFLQRPHERRKNWTRRLDVPDSTQAETLYFVGCVISYTPSMRPASAGVTAILNAANEAWALLGEEWCCGVPLKFGGGTESFKEFVSHNVDMIEASGAKRVVFSCPGCYRMFKQEYPKILGRSLKFATLHIAEYVPQLLAAGKLQLKDKLNEKISYHDPCELSRLMGVIDDPREALAASTTAFVELPENKLNTHCCGGGGLYKGVDTESSLEIARGRITQAEQVGSESLVSACPSCILNLSQAARRAKSTVKVLDFADVIARQLKEE
ncbi:MAG: (Fe-S)-binding protein [Candidatus Bathyarchaeota archaeon]|jgi:heterodisulfide reductase subunit D|nr:(Fe-S)-binding protein [Candidatus Bathyarchaeota archaeon]